MSIRQGESNASQTTTWSNKASGRFNHLFVYAGSVLSGSANPAADHHTLSDADECANANPAAI